MNTAEAEAPKLLEVSRIKTVEKRNGEIEV